MLQGGNLRLDSNKAIYASYVLSLDWRDNRDVHASRAASAGFFEEEWNSHDAASFKISFLSRAIRKAGKKLKMKVGLECQTSDTSAVLQNTSLFCSLSRHIIILMLPPV